VDITEKPPTVLSICTGYGGLEEGIERVLGKINVLTHVEIEAFAIANLVNKMETDQMAPVPIWTDLKTFQAKFFRGFVDILTGGYPCQPFSAAGLRKGPDDPRHLWPFIKTIIGDCRPRCIFFENVEGHLSKGITEVLADLEKMAYVSKCGVFSAAEVGAYQVRKRVFILAYSNSFDVQSRWGMLPGVYRQKEGVREERFGRSRRRWKGREWYAEPGLGRIANGITDQVDRLRLLGNGVVPETAEKAFRTLHKQLTTDL